jgi:hypothetical protein
MKAEKTQSVEQHNKLLLIVILSVLCAILNSVYAIDKDSLASAKNAAASTAKPSYQFSGYFDTYFFTNLNAPSTRNNLGNCNCARGFDRYVNQFQLGMLLTQLNYTNNNVEFVGEVGFGPNMQYASYGSAYGYKWGTVLASGTYTAVLIKQAYIKLKASQKLSFTMGQFGTHIGYEFIDAPLNFHYSINNTFNSGVPFYHVGLKANYAINNQVTVMGGLVNGTDNINNNNNSLKFIGQVVLTPSNRLELSFNTIQGNEANARVNGKDTTSYFGVLDFVANYQVSSKLKIGTWVMYGSQRGEFQGGTYFQQMRHWSGVNLYTQYKLSESFSIGTRVEHFDNTDGVRPLLTNGKGTFVDTYTITGNIHLQGGALILKPEIRFDNFEKIKSQNGEVVVQQFADSNGNFTRNSQTTIGMAAILKF